MSDDDLVYEKLMRDISKHQAAGATDPAPVEGPRIIPPVLYLPVREIAEGQHIPEVRELPDGRSVLVVYTALDRLAERCGAAQPWILIPTDELGSIKEHQPFDAVSFDPQFSEHLVSNGRLA